jgi:hypothetical protein
MQGRALGASWQVSSLDFQGQSATGYDHHNGCTLAQVPFASVVSEDLDTPLSLLLFRPLQSLREVRGGKR